MKSDKSVILAIDTSDNKKTEVNIIIDGKKISKTSSNDWTSQILLPLIEKLLDDHKLKLKDLTAISVNPGPGSYTGIRVGVAVANTLSYLLQIPVNGKKGKSVDPRY